MGHDAPAGIEAGAFSFKTRVFRAEEKKPAAVRSSAAARRRICRGKGRFFRQKPTFAIYFFEKI
jgi:hypothetical protein